MIWYSRLLRIPIILCLVVCAFGVMIESLSPIRAFIKDDLPALGLPMMLTKPDLKVIRKDSHIHPIHSNLNFNEMNVAF